MIVLSQGTNDFLVQMNHSANLPDIVPTFEQQYRQYLSMFDGVMKDEQALYLAKVKFNLIYHGKVQSTEYGGCLNRDQIEHLHEIYFSLGSKITLLYFKNEDLQTVNVKFQVVNKQENTTFHNILTLEDNKIVKVQTKEDYDEDMLDFLLEMA
ncbi:hypothetical protein ACHAWT_009042 [Skeletonema menzelii]|mmetsp:Transcript_6083/g.10285  ORF Transcript_6083/g.10285 Transcript_6083/m.10285 type:complete len:153 (+) Transcript_6083:154-612(+)